MKKLWLCVLTVICLCVTMAFAACGKSPEPPATYTVTVAVNEQGYGTVSETSLTGVAKNTAITVNGATLTIGETAITATATQSTAQYTYAFSGWTVDAETVTEDITVTANFTRTVKTYTVIWANEDGTAIETDTDVPYGTVPTFDGEDPTKDSDAEFAYTFDGWDSEVVAVTGDTTYTATFDTSSSDGYIVSSFTYDPYANAYGEFGNTTPYVTWLESEYDESGVMALGIEWYTGYQDRLTYTLWTGSKTISNDEDVIRIHLRGMSANGNPVCDDCSIMVNDTKYTIAIYPGVGWNSYWENNVGSEEWKWLEIGVSSFGLHAGDKITSFGVFLDISGRVMVSYGADSGAATYTGPIIYVDAVELSDPAYAISRFTYYDTNATAASANSNATPTVTWQASAYDESGVMALGFDAYNGSQDVLTYTLWTGSKTVASDDDVIRIHLRSMAAIPNPIWDGLWVSANGTRKQLSCYAREPDWSNWDSKIGYEEWKWIEVSVSDLGLEAGDTITSFEVVIGVHNNEAKDYSYYGAGTLITSGDMLWVDAVEFKTGVLGISAEFDETSAAGNLPAESDLDDLKQYLTVTAIDYSTGESTLEASDYTLSGNLLAGQQTTITVTYEGMTTTFKVTADAAPVTEAANVISSFSSNPNATAASANSNATPTVTWQASAYDENGVMALGLDSYNGAQDVLTYTLWTGSKTVSANDDVIRIHLRSMAAIPNPIWDGLWVSANGGTKKMLDRYAREPDWSSWDSKIGYEEWKWIEVSVSDLGLEAGDTITSFEVVIGVHNNEAKDYSYYGAGTLITSGDMLWVDAVELSDPAYAISRFSYDTNATAASANSNATPTVTWQASAYDESGVMALGFDAYNGSQDVLTYTLWTGSKTVASDDDVIRIHLRSMAAIPNPIWDGLWVSANGTRKQLSCYAREPDWSNWDSTIGYETWKWIEVNVSDLGLHAGDTITSFEVVIGVHNNEAKDYSYYGAGTLITSGDMLWVDAVEFKVA